MRPLPRPRPLRPVRVPAPAVRLQLTGRQPPTKGENRISIHLARCLLPVRNQIRHRAPKAGETPHPAILPPLRLLGQPRCPPGARIGLPLSMTQKDAVIAAARRQVPRQSIPWTQLRRQRLGEAIRQELPLPAEVPRQRPAAPLPHHRSQSRRLSRHRHPRELPRTEPATPRNRKRRRAQLPRQTRRWPTTSGTPQTAELQAAGPLLRGAAGVVAKHPSGARLPAEEAAPPHQTEPEHQPPSLWECPHQCRAPLLSRLQPAPQSCPSVAEPSSLPCHSPQRAAPQFRQKHSTRQPTRPRRPPQPPPPTRLDSLPLLSVPWLLQRAPTAPPYLPPPSRDTFQIAPWPLKLFPSQGGHLAVARQQHCHLPTRSQKQTTTSGPLRRLLRHDPTIALPQRPQRLQPTASGGPSCRHHCAMHHHQRQISEAPLQLPEPPSRMRQRRAARFRRIGAAHEQVLQQWWHPLRPWRQ